MNLTSCGSSITQCYYQGYEPISSCQHYHIVVDLDRDHSEAPQNVVFTGTRGKGTCFAMASVASMIGCWHDNVVCLSAGLSVCDVVRCR